MKPLLLTLVLLPIQIHAAQTAQNLVRQGSGIKVGEIVIAMKNCLYDQAQFLTNQYQSGNDSVQIGTEPDWAKDEYGQGTAYGQDDEYEFKDHEFAMMPSVTMDGAWTQGACNGFYGSVGFNADDENFIFSKIHYCEGSTHDNRNDGDLEIPLRALPLITYRSENRSKAFDNLGARAETDDIIKKLTLTSPESSGSKIQMINATTKHSAQVYFDAGAYSSCLINKLGF